MCRSFFVTHFVTMKTLHELPIFGGGAKDDFLFTVNFDVRNHTEWGIRHLFFIPLELLDVTRESLEDLLQKEAP